MPEPPGDDLQNLQVILRPKTSVTSRRLGDEMVLLNLDTGVYFGLNAVGMEVWEGMVRGISLAAVVEEIKSAYDVSRERCEEDVLKLARDLLAEGLAERNDA